MAKREHSEEDTIMSLRRDGERVMGNIRDARTVIRVADEAWSDQSQSFLGMLDLLDHKLLMIESGTKSLLENHFNSLAKGCGDPMPGRTVTVLKKILRSTTDRKDCDHEHRHNTKS